jgi:hypothetical protein
VPYFEEPLYYDKAQDKPLVLGLDESVTPPAPVEVPRAANRYLEGYQREGWWRRMISGGGR